MQPGYVLIEQGIIPFVLESLAGQPNNFRHGVAISVLD